MNVEFKGNKFSGKIVPELLDLAERGLYTTTPNPRVGCVIVRGDEAIGYDAKGAETIKGRARAFNLSKDEVERMVRESAAAYCCEKLAPRVLEQRLDLVVREVGRQELELDPARGEQRPVIVHRLGEQGAQVDSVALQLDLRGVGAG